MQTNRMCNLERGDGHVLDAEVGVGVDEGLGGLGALGAGGGGQDWFDVVLDGVAEDGHVGAAGRGAGLGGV